MSFAAVFLFGGAAAAIAIGVAALATTGEGAVKLDFSDAAAARKCTVAIDGNEIGAAKLDDPIKLRPGKHQLRVRRGNLQIEALEFDVRGRARWSFIFRSQPVGKELHPRPSRSSE